MKLNKLFILALFVFIAVISLGTAHAQEEIVNAEGAFVFPGSLEIIEAEAFEGTAVETVLLPEGFLSIGERAFHRAIRLMDIYIPDTTEYIADSAFPEHIDFTIHGIDGSYAEAWAEEHRVRFVVDDIWNAIPVRDGSLNGHSFLAGRRHETINPVKLINANERSVDEGRSRRPHERPELNPIDYRFP